LETLSAAESYLQQFHQRQAGATSRAFADLPARVGATEYPSSYALLASAVPAGVQPLTVLDLACGDGYLLSLLGSAPATARELIGVDMSEGELAAARARLPASVRLLQQRAQQLSIASGSVDYVVSHMALMLMDDIEQVLAEIRRVLRAQGTFAAVVGRQFLTGPVMQVFLDVFRPIAKQDGLPHLAMGDARTRTEAGWRALLERDFIEVQCTEVELPWYPQPDKLWADLLETYDVDRLTAPARERCRIRMLEALRPLQQADGTLVTGSGLYFLSAQAA